MMQPNAASMTNQRLDVARRFIRQMQDKSEQWMGAAYENAALFHLNSALNGLYQEVTQIHQLGAVISLDVLLQAADKKGVVIPVLSELKSLQSDSNSWLKQLDLAYQVSFECRPKASIVQSSTMIVQDNGGAGATQFYLNSLTDLVLRFREDSAEY